MSLPSRWMPVLGAFAGWRRERDVEVGWDTHEHGERAVREDEAAVGVVGDGDRDRRAVDDGLE
jgi:hypothetical protein